MNTKRNDEDNGIIILHSGTFFDLKGPPCSHFEIADIAHALSQLCRFGGHTPFFYSVAQHALSVSALLPPKLRLAGLLHDAAEAYLGDVTAPLKRLLPDYRALEASIERALFAAFGIDYPLHAEVKRADRLVLAAECRDFFGDFGNESSVLPKIEPLASGLAKQLFIDRFHELTGS